MLPFTVTVTVKLKLKKQFLLCVIKINDHIIKYKAENSDVMMCRSHELPQSFSSEFILRFTHIS